MKPGRLKKTLAKLLREKGLEVDPASFWVQQGAHRQCDGARWGSNYGKWLDGRFPGQIMIRCWDTMTDCVRHGVSLTAGPSNGLNAWEAEVHSKQ